MSDDDRPTPGIVTGAVSVGTAPLPFLAVYTLLFLGHGLIHPVHPPDITSTQRGEVIAGCVTGVLFILLCTSVIWFLNGSRRWPFAVLQLGVAAAGAYFLADGTKGGPVISVLLMLAALLSLLLAFAPDAWTHVGGPGPQALRRGYRTLHLGAKDDAPNGARHDTTNDAVDDATGYSTAR